MENRTSSTKLISWVDYSVFHSSDFNWIKGAVAIALVIHGFALRVLVEFTPPSGVVYGLVHAGLAVGALVSFILLAPSLFRDSFQAIAKKSICVETGFLLGLLILFGVSLNASIKLETPTYYEVIPFALAIYTLSRYWLSRKKRIIKACLPVSFNRVERCYRVESNGSVTRIPLVDLVVGDEIKVSTSQLVPVDGVVVSGRGYVSEASLNGSTFPKLKQAGDPILAGSKSEDGVFTIKTLSTFVPRKLQDVENPLLSLDKNQSDIRLNQTIFTLLVFSVAFVCAGVSIIVAGLSGAVVILATCLIAGATLTWVSGTPVHQWTGLVHLGKRGLYGKSPDFVSKVAEADRAFFGKTGVISKQELGLERFFVMPVFQDREDWIISIVSQTSLLVNHPLVNALSSVESLIQGDAVSEDLSCEVFPGLGVEVSLTDGHGRRVKLRIGEAEFVLWKGGQSRLSGILEEHDLNEGQRIWISLDNRLCAIAKLKEYWNVSPQPFFAQLEYLGVKPGVLTGDSDFNCARFDGLHLAHGLSSFQKQEEVAKAKRASNRVLYIGDGLNDYRAMSEADVCVAMRHAPDSVLGMADAVLKSDQVSSIITVISYCRRIVRLSKRNQWFFCGAFMLTSAAASVGWISPIMAALYFLGCFASVWLQSFLFGCSTLSNVVKQTRTPQVSLQGSRRSYAKYR